MNDREKKENPRQRPLKVKSSKFKGKTLPSDTFDLRRSTFDGRERKRSTAVLAVLFVASCGMRIEPRAPIPTVVEGELYFGLLRKYLAHDLLATSRITRCAFDPP
jgi:hypothetical protein